MQIWLARFLSNCFFCLHLDAISNPITRADVNKPMAGNALQLRRAKDTFVQVCLIYISALHTVHSTVPFRVSREIVSLFQRQRFGSLDVEVWLDECRPDEAKSI